MNSTAISLIALAITCFALVLSSHVRMSLICETGLAIVGLAAFGAGQGLLDGNESPSLLLDQAVAMAIVGAVLVAVGFYIRIDRGHPKNHGERRVSDRRRQR